MRPKAREIPIPPGEKVGLKLTKAQRSLLLGSMPPIPSKAEQAIRSASTDDPVMLTLGDLDNLAGPVAALANHAEDKSLREKYDRISRKIEKLLDTYTDEPSTGEEAPSRFAIDLLDIMADKEPLVLPLPSRSKKGGERFPVKLTAKQREALMTATRLRQGLKNRIKQAAGGTPVVEFARKELDEMAEEIDTSLAFAPSPYKKRLEAVLDQIDDLWDALEEEPIRQARAVAETSGLVYQLKVTLKDIKPPIWRRIGVPDGTLGELHEVFQVVMGWEDYHLHQFIIRGEYYGPRPPEPFDLEMETEDEKEILLSQVARMGKRVRFTYEYDFGDGWRHEIVLEKTLEPEPKVRYPRCIEGERACPPEDCGGPWGYADFLEAMANPKHERHRELKEWVGGKFDPETFSVEAVNKELRRYASR